MRLPRKFDLLRGQYRAIEQIFCLFCKHKDLIWTVQKRLHIILIKAKMNGLTADAVRRKQCGNAENPAYPHRGYICIDDTHAFSS